MEHEEKLRDELLGWQAGQRELHRWKLVAIGSLTALGLGLTSQQGQPNLLVICLAPFIAAYCDALLRDHDLRIGLIGFFLLSRSGGFAEYERFIETRPVGISDWWRLGRSAAMQSSLGACALTAAAGAYGLWFGSFSRQAWFECAATFLSAGVGALLVRRVDAAFVRGYARLREAADSDYANSELLE